LQFEYRRPINIVFTDGENNMFRLVTMIVLAVPYQESLDGWPDLFHINDKPLRHAIFTGIERLAVPRGLLVAVEYVANGPVIAPLRFVVDYFPCALFPIVFAGRLLAGPDGYVGYVGVRRIRPV